MATLTVRDIDDADYERLRQVARENKRSAAAQVRAMIAEIDRKPSDVAETSVAARLADFRKRHKLRISHGRDSVALIRSLRDDDRG